MRRSLTRALFFPTAKNSTIACATLGPTSFTASSASVALSGLWLAAFSNSSMTPKCAARSLRRSLADKTNPKPQQHAMQPRLFDRSICCKQRIRSLLAYSFQLQQARRASNDRDQQSCESAACASRPALPLPVTSSTRHPPANLHTLPKQLRHHRITQTLDIHHSARSPSAATPLRTRAGQLVHATPIHLSLIARKLVSHKPDNSSETQSASTPRMRSCPPPPNDLRNHIASALHRNQIADAITQAAQSHPHCAASPASP